MDIPQTAYEIEMKTLLLKREKITAIIGITTKLRGHTEELMNGYVLSYGIVDSAPYRKGVAERANACRASILHLDVLSGFHQEVLDAIDHLIAERAKIEKPN